MSDADAKRLVDELCDLSSDSREAWFAEHRVDPALRRRVESILARFDALMENAGALPDPVSSLLPGPLVPPRPEKIGPYRVLDTLGAGGMGVVYLAEQTVPHRRVAIKVLRGGVLAEDVRRRFEREAELLGRLQHRGIAQVIELGRAASGESYLVMEYIEGVRITDHAADRGLSREQRIDLLVELAEAVHHAHLRGVVHRDLKPANVLVTAEGQVKVIDFGVARALDADGLATLETRAGQVIGTLAYMSPEQMRGDPLATDARADVYALGVLAYELLGGRLPHDLTTASVARAARILDEVEPPSLGRVAPSCRGDLEIVVRTALAKDPERRYASAAAFAADLRRVRTHEAILARPPTLIYQLGRLARRHRGFFAGLILAVAALLVGAGVALRYASIAQDRAAELVRRTDPARLLLARERAEALWPALPERLSAMDAWLENEAEPLRANFPVHVAQLAEMRARASHDEGDTASPTIRFSDPDLQERHDNLARLVTELEAFFDPEEGLVADVESRRARAGRAVAETITDPEPASEWSAAREDILALPVYAGLELEPQVGLRPLRRDPRSGLWEFWVVTSGERPRVASDPSAPSAWDIVEETGIVLVLLPGGTVTLGAQSVDPAAPRYDPGTNIAEGEIRRVELPAILVSKYELTQAQWKRLDRSEPSLYGPRFQWLGSPPRDTPITVSTFWNPVESISMNDAARVLRRLGLRLPSGDEWEYAARGGTDTPWWTGDQVGSLQGAANIADGGVQRQGGPPAWSYETELEDDYVVHAPVGTFAANPFGLHDVLGNVWEWTTDQPEPGVAAIRGGSYEHDASRCRATARDFGETEDRSRFVGIRAVMSLRRTP